MNAEQSPRKRKDDAPPQPRKRYSIGAQVSATEYERLELEWTVRGCSPTELVRAALGLDEAAAVRPLLVAAGQVVRPAMLTLPRFGAAICLLPLLQSTN